MHSYTDIKQEIPEEINTILEKIHSKNFEAFLVGGCVRDLFLKQKPKDWDITTNATPDQIQGLFEETFYENNFGTVGVVNGSVSDETLRIVEITPYRTEGLYTDKRRPDEIHFSPTIEPDLDRRDFTINAIAYDPLNNVLKDPHKGQNDIKDKVIKTVGIASERFQEDALRMLRAVRLQAELGFIIEEETQKAITDNSSLLSHISQERIRDEFSRIINSKEPMISLVLSHKMALLQFILPELEDMINIEQGGIHQYDVWEHSLRALQHAADKNLLFNIRLAALLHDIGKPATRRPGLRKSYTFYGHEVVGARIAKKVLERLKFSHETVKIVVNLVRWHMFFSDPDKITPSAVRRLIANVGKENVWDLINIRMCDRIGTGRPKENPYRLRQYQAMIEEVMSDPTSVSMLKIDGKKIMDVTHETPGPRIGLVLQALLGEVLENPQLNTEGYLAKRANELITTEEQTLKDLAEKGKVTQETVIEEKKGQIRKKHNI